MPLYPQASRKNSLNSPNASCYRVQKTFEAHKNHAGASLLAKRTGNSALRDFIVVFKFSRDSKSDQIFTGLNSDRPASMPKHDFARCGSESRHDNIDFHLAVYRRTVAGYNKNPPQSDIPAIANSGMRRSIAPMKDDGEDQLKTGARPSLDPGASRRGGGIARHDL